MDRRVTLEEVADLRACANVPYDVALSLPNGAFGPFGPEPRFGTPEYAAADAHAISPALVPPPEPIPGWRVRGSLWPGEHFIARIPKQWNGRLVVAGTPALRSEYANDSIWSDPLVARGYAYVSGNKSQGDGIVVLTGDARIDIGGVTLPRYFLPDGKGVSFWQHAPGSTFRLWMRDFFSITDVAKESIVQVHGTEPEVVYAVGLSNGGGQVRFALECSDAYDGGLVWNSVLWTQEHNLLRHHPQAIELMERGQKDGIENLGFPRDIAGRDGDSLYAKNYRIYWRLTAWLHAMVFDPETSITYEDVRDPRPAESWNERIGSWRLERKPQILERIGAYAHYGNIRSKMIDLASQYDHFITPQMHWEPYGKLVAAAGKTASYRARLIENAQHVDAWSEDANYPQLRPGHPDVLAAFDELVTWVEG